MVSPQLAGRRILAMIGLLVLAAMACNAPLVGNSATVEPDEPTRQASTPVLPTATLGAPETLPPDLTTQEPESEEVKPSATVTTEAQPTLRPTSNASPTTRPRPTLTPTRRPSGPTPTPSVNQTGPLQFEYRITWRLAANDPWTSIARVEISATGGGGGYQYFRDDLAVEGPVFEYQWVSCKSNPGSLRVDSADGQSVRVNYSQEPPCPTRTPTPSP